MPPRAKTKLPPPSTAHSSADAQPGLQQGAQRTRDRILQAARELVLEEGASRCYRVQYERVRRSPRGTETAALIMLALDGALFADLLGLPILAPAERRHFFRALQDLASGHLELVPAKGRT